jgi:hypothetical protein
MSIMVAAPIPSPWDVSVEEKQCIALHCIALHHFHVHCIASFAVAF